MIKNVHGNTVDLLGEDIVSGRYAVGAALPLLMVLLLPVSALMWGVAGSSLTFLALLGFLAARAGGAAVFGGSAGGVFVVWRARRSPLGSPRRFRGVGPGVRVLFRG